MGKIILITGGAKSGKSKYALAQGESLPGRKLFIATAEAFDKEMEEKIRKHRSERSGIWETHETDKKKPAQSLIKHINLQARENTVVLIDCLTLWLTNILMADEFNEKTAQDTLQHTITTLINTMLSSNASFLLVTNELGMGIVPENKLARKFRELSGEMNSMIANAADELYLVVAGIPLKLK